LKEGGWSEEREEKEKGNLRKRGRGEEE